MVGIISILIINIYHIRNSTYSIRLIIAILSSKKYRAIGGELTTVLTPIFFAVRITLHAISPLFAIRILSKGKLRSTRVLNDCRSAYLICRQFIPYEYDLHESIARLSLSNRLVPKVSIKSVKEG